MKRMILALAFMAVGVTANAQSDYYLRKAEQYQRQAEYYQEKAATYLRWAAEALRKHNG